MAETTYAELLRDPRWQRKRLEILHRDNWMCSFCEDTETTLHVHHKQYRWGKKPWEYDNDDLETLCETCHQRETDASKALKQATARLPVGESLSRVAGYAVGLRVAHWWTPGADSQPPWLRDDVDLVDYEMAIGIVAGVSDVADITADEIMTLVNDGTLDLEKLAAILRPSRR